MKLTSGLFAFQAWEIVQEIMEEIEGAVRVMKFGGTSVENAEACRRLVDIVLRQQSAHAVVVVSALSGVTDALLGGVHAAAVGCVDDALRKVETELQRYVRVGEEFLKSQRLAHLQSELSKSLAGIAELLRVIGGHPVTRRLVQDEIISHGERLSAVLLAEVLLARGIPAACVDARRFIITDEQHGNASPLREECASRTRAELRPLLEQGKVPVLGGFIGASKSGATTTLGRGGSDYTAALVGAALGAAEIQIWTDVTGVLTADPRVVRGARTISRLSYAEAAELAYFGAKVLHPKTIQPAVEGRIPVRICNSRVPEEPGTLVSGDTETAPSTVKAIAHKKGITVLQVSSARMLGAYGFLRALFKVFDRQHTVVDVVTTSEVSVSLSIDDTRNLDVLLGELQALGSVDVESDRAIICVVGEGMRATTGIAAKVFGTIPDVHIAMISQGASEINLTFVVESTRADEVVARLHAAFFDTPESGKPMEAEAGAHATI